MRWWIAVFLIMLTACGNQVTGDAAQELTEQVTIKSNSFEPLVLYIKPGTTVTWTNKDSQPHTVTTLGVFDSGTLGRRHSFSHRFDYKGTYTYKDLFNNDIVGRVVVK